MTLFLAMLVGPFVVGAWCAATRPGAPNQSRREHFLAGAGVVFMLLGMLLWVSLLFYFLEGAPSL